jgi:hypothetical protein
VCEHVFVTAHGHAYARFRRALGSGNPHLAMEAARGLRHVDLADALSLCLLLRDGDPLRYEPAAVRWLARLLERASPIGLRDAAEVAELLVGVGAHQRVAEIRLERWLRARGLETEADRVSAA